MSSDTVPGTRTPETEGDPRPVVALPRPGVPGIAIAAVALAAAVLLFIALDARRRSAAQERAAVRAPQNAFAAPPPLFVPPGLPADAPITLVRETAPRSSGVPSAAPLPGAPPLSSYAQRDPVPYQSSAQPIIVPVGPDPIRNDPRDADAARAGTPAAKSAGAGSALIIDGGGGVVAEAANADERPVQGPAAGAQSRTSPGTGGDDAPARLASIGDQTMVMPTGTVIPAVLETPIDTARPGLVRAVVSRDTRGFDGRRVLVPRGSRLIGEYQADVRSGQNRVLVTWNRLIRPDGGTIRLVSPTADPLGGAGVPGHVQTFFWQRFASALLQSALTVGVNLASRPGNGAVVIGLPGGQINSVVGQSLLPGNDLRPKITVRQGAALTVFVARDLDFSGVAGRP